MWYTYAARLLKFKVLFGNNFYINQLISQSLLGSGGKTVNSYPGSYKQKNDIPEKDLIEFIKTHSKKHQKS